MDSDALKNFLNTVITTQEGNLLLAAGDGTGGWWEEFYNYPKEIDKFISRAEDIAKTYNVYFSAHLFNSRQALKVNVLPSRTIQADLDESDLVFPIAPAVVLQTSPGRHQAFWVLQEEIDLEILESYSRNLTYSIDKCDRSGWTLGHLMRLPGTVNYKRKPDLFTIEISEISNRSAKLIELDQLPALETYALNLEHYDEEWLNNTGILVLDSGPLEILESIRDKLPPQIYLQYDIVQQDRSIALWALMCAAFRAGLDKSQVFVMARGSANNKFLNLKYHSDLELGKDVLRAQEAVQGHVSDSKSLINLARHTHSAVDRRNLMTKIVLDRMKKHGTFLRATNGTSWYVRKDTGRPIQISKRSEYLHMMLSVEFGLNAVEVEQRYVTNEIESYALTLPENGIVSTLSHLDLEQNMVLLHTGRQNVLRILPDSITNVYQGYENAIFPWITSIEPFQPTYDPEFDWGEYLFRISIAGAIDIPHDDLIVLLKVWTLFLILRSACVDRPILTLIGQQGGGKSTLFRRVYTVLYGRNRALSSATKPEDFDLAVSTDCLLVLDNLDTYEPWLLDRLALISSSTDIIKRKLYTDIDTVIVKRQAVLGITSHSPHFAREDIADRLLIISFKRLEHWLSNSVVLDALALQRGRIWGGIIKDLQKVLGTEIPDEYPQFRIEDFARIGSWIAMALDSYLSFVNVIEHVKNLQSRFMLDEDQLLADSLLRYVAKQNGTSPWVSVSSLWSILEMLSPNPTGFSRRYKSANSLGRKLTAFSEPLKRILKVDNIKDPVHGTTLWKFSQKEV